MTEDTVTRLDDARIEELRAQHTPRLDWRDLLIVSDPDGELGPSDADALKSYFAQFAPLSAGKCLNCEAPQGGDMVASLLGIAKFRWGLAHGEGFCSSCHYPARAYHYDVGPLKRLMAVLQYHPEELMTQAERAIAKDEGGA